MHVITAGLRRWVGTFKLLVQDLDGRWTQPLLATSREDGCRYQGSEQTPKQSYL